MKKNFTGQVIAKETSILHVSPAVPVVYQSGIKPLEGRNRVAISGIFRDNNAPAGIKVVTNFYKNGVVVNTQTTTTIGATTKDVLTALATHTHASIDEFDAYESVVTLLTSTTLDFRANLFVDAYYQDDENYLLVSNIAYDAEIVEGASAVHANPIVSSVQLKDIVGNNIGEEISVIAYVSSDADGDTPVATGVLDIGSKGKRIEVLTADASAIFKTDNTGLLELSMTKATAGTLYLNIMLPNGKQKHSAPIVWS